MTASDASTEPMPIGYGVWSDRPGYTGLAIRRGALAMLVKGRGMILGPLNAQQMDDIAFHILAITKSMHAQDDRTADAALAQLDAALAGDHEP